MTQIAARVSEEEKKKLEKYCKENDIKMSQVIRRAVKEYLDRYAES